MDLGLTAVIVTAAVALYGAGLSTYTALSDRRDKRRLVNVELSHGFLTLHNGQLSDAMFIISASNPGNRTVTIGTPSIKLPDGQQIIMPNPESNVRFPHELQEGKNCTVWTDIKQLAATLAEHGYSGKVKLVGAYSDLTGKTYKSKPFKFNIDGWIEQAAKKGIKGPGA